MIEIDAVINEIHANEPNDEENVVGDKKKSLKKKLARACGVPVDLCSCGRLAITLVATINDILFSFSFLSFLFSPSSTFLREGVLGSKNLFSKSWQERPKT